MFYEKPRLRGLAIIFGLFVFGLLVTAVLDLTGWDLQWSEQFYKAAGIYKGWFLRYEQPWAFLYKYGEYPTWILAALALALCVAAKLGKVPRAVLQTLSGSNTNRHSRTGLVGQWDSQAGLG